MPSLSQPDPRLKLRHLRCLLAVLRHGGIGAAAADLGTTQPAVSKTLRELEEILGVRLVLRGRGGTVPTPAGLMFRRHAEAVLAALGEGVAGLARLGGGARETVRIGALPTVAARLMPLAVERHLHAGGRAVLRVVSGTNTALLGDLRVGGLDLVVGRMAEGDGMSGLTFEHLYSEPVVFAVRAGHPLTCAGGFDPTRIAGFPVVLPTPGSIIRPSVDRLLRTLGIAELPTTVETVSPAFARVFVAGTDAVWIISLGVVETDLGAGGLVLLPVDARDTSGPVGLTLRAGQKPSDAVLGVVETLRGAAATIRARG